MYTYNLHKVHQLYSSKKKIGDLNTHKNIKKWAEELNRHFSKEDIQMAKRHLKRCSTPLITREIQTKTKEVHLTSVRMAVIKKIRSTRYWRGCGEKGTTIPTIGGNVNWYSHYGEQNGGSLKNSK